MPLFDEKIRTETRPSFQNEAVFDYLNSSTRASVCAVREMLEGWYAHLPETAKDDIRGRFRSRDSVQHQSSFFELYWHEFLLCCGYEVEIHPTLSGVKTSPDFLSIRDGTPQFYLEATLAMPPINLAADRRLAALHDTLNRMDSPDYFLSIEYRGSPEGNIRGRLLRKQLEAWLKGLEFEEVSSFYAAQQFDAVPTFPWSEGSLTLEFAPIPKGPKYRGLPGVRQIGVVMPMEMRVVRAHDDIRVAIKGKAKKYGSLKLPFVIAVNVMEDFFDDVDTRNALFGEEQVVVTRMSDGTFHHNWRSRVPNGAWVGRKGPRNTLVSAVFLTNQLSPWTLRSETVELIHNPWAVNPLPQDAFPVPQIAVSLPDGIIHKHEGRCAADLLGVPQPWPILEQ
jgi:hypothetical protein